MFRSPRWWLWLLCGIGVALLAFRTASLAEQFTWGDTAHWADRPIPGVLLWWLVGWLLYAAALRLGAALPPRVPSLIALLAIAAVARGAYFGTNPIQEDDAYRYLWDGQVVNEGVDPYRWSPAEVAGVNLSRAQREATALTSWRVDPGAPELDAPPGDLKRLASLVPEFRPGRVRTPSKNPAVENFRKINNAFVPTVYPPLNMPLFAACQRLWPWKLDGLRFAFLLLELASIALIWFALRAAGANPMWAAVYAWCPMVIKEMANSPHHDALVVCCLSAFLLCAVAERPRLAAAALALAVAAKLYPLALLPVLLAWAWRRDRRSAVAAGGVFAAVLLACYAPFLHAHTFRGAGVFASSWGSNAGVFTLIENAFKAMPHGSEKLTTLIGEGTKAELYSRIVAGAIIAGGVAAAALSNVPRPSIAPVGRSWQLPFRCFLALAVGFAFSPAQHPWYFAGILPFVALFPYRSWVLLTALLGIYYLKFWFDYDPSRWSDLQSRLGQHEIAPWDQERDFPKVRVLEWAPFYALLAYEGLKGWLRAAEAPKA